MTLFPATKPQLPKILHLPTVPFPHGSSVFKSPHRVQLAPSNVPAQGTSSFSMGVPPKSDRERVTSTRDQEMPVKDYVTNRHKLVTKLRPKAGQVARR